MVIVRIQLKVVGGQAKKKMRGSEVNESMGKTSISETKMTQTAKFTS